MIQLFYKNKKSLTLPQKVILKIMLSSFTFRYTHKKNLKQVLRHTLVPVIHRSPKVERTQMSMESGTDAQMVYTHSGELGCPEKAGFKCPDCG